jgi:hypothetical protein
MSYELSHKDKNALTTATITNQQANQGINQQLTTSLHILRQILNTSPPNYVALLT